MDKMPQWADIVLIPLISLILAAVLSALVILSAASGDSRRWSIRTPLSFCQAPA